MTRNIPFQPAYRWNQSVAQHTSSTDNTQPRQQRLNLDKPQENTPASYTAPFLSFITENPTVFHAVSHYASRLSSLGFKKLSERRAWSTELATGGAYFVERNGSSLIAFVVGADYEAGNGAAVVAGHVDALTARRTIVLIPFGCFLVLTCQLSETDTHIAKQSWICSTRYDDCLFFMAKSG